MVLIRCGSRTVNFQNSDRTDGTEGGSVFVYKMFNINVSTENIMKDNATNQILKKLKTINTEIRVKFCWFYLFSPF